MTLSIVYPKTHFAGQRLGGRPLRLIDTALSPLAERWLQQLPAPTRPVQLVNRLALCWPDRALTAQVFEALFSAKRGHRREFPMAVLAELKLLRQHSASLAG